MFSILIISHSLLSLSFFYFFLNFQKGKKAFCFLLVCNCEGVGSCWADRERMEPAKRRKEKPSLEVAVSVAAVRNVSENL
jgi:hypothetical protein